MESYSLFYKNANVFLNNEKKRKCKLKLGKTLAENADLTFNFQR